MTASLLASQLPQGQRCVRNVSRLYEGGGFQAVLELVQGDGG